eukprot:5446264-Pyramimonas_sp.AAC.1
MSEEPFYYATSISYFTDISDIGTSLPTERVRRVGPPHDQVGVTSFVIEHSSRRITRHRSGGEGIQREFRAELAKFSDTNVCMFVSYAVLLRGRLGWDVRAVIPKMRHMSLA